ncbi:MAG: DJ-1 family glyoxalase III [Planctomycetota bacterium]
MARVLVIVAEGAEETELMTVADTLVRCDQEVVLAAGGDLHMRGSRMLPLCADRPLDEAARETWDCIYLPGGAKQAEFCVQDQRVQTLIREQLGSERLLAIICASPQALLPQDLARDRRLTCYPGLRDRVEPGAREWVDAAVVEDGNLITSQGPGTAAAMGLAIGRRLAGETVAKGVAGQMLVPWPF